MLRLLTAAALLLLALAGPMPAAAMAEEAGASSWARTDQADLRLIAARTATGLGPGASAGASAGAGASGGETVRLGLEVVLRPGWKVYWRSPGDAGYPPSIDWTGSENLAAVDMAWPAPHRFTLFGIETAGYARQVVFPLTAHVADPAAPLVLAAQVDFLVCEQICIPGAATLTLDLPAGPGEPAPGGHLIEQFAARVPGAGHGISLDSAVIEAGAAGTAALVVSLRADPPLSAPDLFAEGDLGQGAGRGIVSAAPHVSLTDGGRRASLRAPLLIPVAEDAPPPALTLTVVDDDARGLEVAITPPLAAAVPGLGGLPSPSAGSGGSGGLIAILGAALLGGLILNLMPCVLPVLSLKVLGFIGHGGGERGAIRLAFLASAAGVVAAFLVLAGVLAGLKAAGQAIGWGIQFQEPWFLAAMIAILLLFAANLFGLYEIRLPGLVGALAAPSGGHDGRRPGLGGHFAGGAFATLLATPCSAPFVGTAVGFALARGPGEIVAVFLALGIGMAAPYLLVAAAPGLARSLPRPGPWMVSLRRAFGVALALTALWLGWVLSGVLAPAPDAPSLRAAEDGRAVAWRSFDRTAIPGLVAAGQVVVVDVTADWCITCKVNKAAVLDRDPVATALAAADVVALRADWTRPDPAIADFLAAHGRYGIPFNVVFGPAAPDGIALPELLTHDAVLTALRTARGG